MSIQLTKKEKERVIRIYFASILHQQEFGNFVGGLDPENEDVIDDDTFETVREKIMKSICRKDYTTVISAQKALDQVIDENYETEEYND